MQSYYRFKRCIFGWTGFLFSIIGQNFLRKNFHQGPSLCILLAIIGAGLVSSINGVLFYDIFTKFFSVMVALLAVQVVMNI